MRKALAVQLGRRVLNQLGNQALQAGQNRLGERQGGKAGLGVGRGGVGSASTQRCRTRKECASITRAT